MPAAGPGKGAAPCRAFFCLCRAVFVSHCIQPCRRYVAHSNPRLRDIPGIRQPLVMEPMDSTQGVMPNRFDPQRVLPLFNFLLTRPTMKKPFAIIAIALSALGAVAAAQAGAETYVPPSFSTLRRAQVL